MADTSRFSLADVSVSARGAKSAQLLSGGERLYFTSAQLTRAPFGPNNFDKDPAATRQNLELRATPDIEAFFSALDAWAIEYITAHSERLFKKSLSLAQVHEMYHPTLRRAPGYEPLLRCKANTAGRGAVQYWTAEGKAREAPVDWKEAEVKAKIHCSHLWLMGSSCGIVLNLQDLLVVEGSRAFPFAPPELP